MGTLDFTGKIAAPQNDEKGLRRFGIVWSHLLKYQKYGVRMVLMTTPSCILGCNRAYLKLNQP